MEVTSPNVGPDAYVLAHVGFEFSTFSMSTSMEILRAFCILMPLDARRFQFGRTGPLSVPNGSRRSVRLPDWLSGAPPFGSVARKIYVLWPGAPMKSVYSDEMFTSYGAL